MHAHEHNSSPQMQRHLPTNAHLFDITGALSPRPAAPSPTPQYHLLTWLLLRRHTPCFSAQWLPQRKPLGHQMPHSSHTRNTPVTCPSPMLKAE
jgi:hypothetical protein